MTGLPFASSTVTCYDKRHDNSYQHALDCGVTRLPVLRDRPSILVLVLFIGSAHTKSITSPFHVAVPCPCEIADVLVPWEENERRNQSFAQEPKCADTRWDLGGRTRRGRPSGVLRSYSPSSTSLQTPSLEGKDTFLANRKRVIQACWERNTDSIDIEGLGAQWCISNM
ncbi:hypothetical protein ARMSODRAFT_85061 [Armillaria solidipes]|uniref:Uncharacterized protein n=1 Tax=Armillaria solidipes TaxID=1076256 RepID=A0A2H3B2G6_9AGAR|nr:hypothetical protein ARMSODRAFT_85061 [Armillaria solidipes]